VLVAGGASNREVAAALYLSPRTVEHHLRMAYRKLGVRSRTEMTSHFGGARGQTTDLHGRDGSPAAGPSGSSTSP
jgi:hypothetical protein